MKGWVGLVGWPIADGLPTIHISGHPSATGRAQDGERTLARDWRSTAEPRGPTRIRTCLRNIESDEQSLDIQYGLFSACRRAQDRYAWRLIVEKAIRSSKVCSRNLRFRANIRRDRLRSCKKELLLIIDFRYRGRPPSWIRCTHAWSHIRCVLGGLYHCTNLLIALDDDDG